MQQKITKSSCKAMKERWEQKEIHEIFQPPGMESGTKKPDCVPQTANYIIFPDLNRQLWQTIIAPVKNTGSLYGVGLYKIY